jgi:hypothetical protein
MYGGAFSVSREYLRQFFTRLIPLSSSANAVHDDRVSEPAMEILCPRSTYDSHSVSHHSYGAEVMAVQPAYMADA